MKAIIVKQSDVDARNKWFHECEKNRTPYVYIIPKTKYATVFWDNIGLPKDAVDNINARPDDYINAIIEVASKHKKDNKKIDFLFSGASGQINNIARESAMRVAEDIYDSIVSVMS